MPHSPSHATAVFSASYESISRSDYAAHCETACKSLHMLQTMGCKCRRGTFIATAGAIRAVRTNRRTRTPLLNLPQRLSGLVLPGELCRRIDRGGQSLAGGGFVPNFQ